MKLTLTLVIFFGNLLLFFGCSPKEAFQFSKNSGSFGEYQREALQNQVTQVIQPVPENKKANAPVIPNANLLAASVQPGLVSGNLSGTGKIMSSTLKTAVSASAIKNLRQVKKLYKVTFKNLSSKPEDEPKTAHKLANVSLALGLGALFSVFLIFIGAPGIGIFLAFFIAIVGVITSRIALNAIRANPNKYSGKGNAQAGFTISLIVLLLFVAALLYLLAFAGAFA
jgi:hypothetical protein